MAERDAITIQIDKLEDRVDREGKINAKQHDEMNERLDKVLNEALKRWPQGMSILVSLLSALVSGLATYAFTHPVK